MIMRLYTLGTTRLEADDGRAFVHLLTQPKPLALLSYLIVDNPGAFQRRDTLLALFWPEHDERHARWALNQAVRRLRSELGASVIPSRGPDALAVRADILWCDAVAFQEACAGGDWSAAVQLYRGEFLAGLHVGGCVELARWMDSQRARLRLLAAHATRSLADRLEARGELREAVERARDGVRLAPEDEPGVRRLIALLDALGDRAGAVQVFEEYVGWLRENFEVEPAPETVAAIRAVKSRAPATATASSSAPESPGSVAQAAMEEQSERGTSARRDRRSVVAITAKAFTAVLLGVTVLWMRGDGRPPDAVDSGAAASSAVSSINSLAVLPFTNLMRDPSQDYFVEGMHEALITELSRIGALKVISRTSTLRYRVTSEPLPQVARELNVDGVIEGSVLREGDRVQITVRLIQGPTDRQLWARTFERQLPGLLALQHDVASAIADEIRIRLTPQEQRALGSAPSVHPQAHLAYLRGRYQLDNGTLKAFQNARDYFLQALDFDPSYAPAYVGLADAYNRLAIQGGRPPRELYPLAKAALVKALQLDQTLAEAHVLHAVVMFRFERDWEGAEQELKRALELEPNNSRAHLAYSTYLLATGHPGEAVTYSTRFRELDPLSPFANENLAWVLYYNGRYDESISRLRSALDLDPRSGVAYSLLGQDYAAKRAYGGALAACDTALGLAPNDDEVVSSCGTVYAVSGKYQAAVALLAEFRQRMSRGYVDPYYVASLTAAINSSPVESDSILRWLSAAYDEQSANLCMLNVDPAFRRLRADPRLQEVVRRMNLPM